MNTDFPRQIKRLYLDLETSPNVVLSWRVGYDIKIDCDNIIKERAIICAGYKWETDKAARIIVWDKNQDDKKLLQKVIAIAKDADEIIMHNGDRFDWPWVMARAAFHGLRVPPVKTVDTLQWARRKFNFNSNKLDYIAKFLGIGGKIKTEFGLWKDICLHSCPKSLKQMADYCKRDVELLERVHKRLEDFVPAKTHVGVLAGRDKWTSPFNGSTKVKKNLTRVTACGGKRHQMQCLTTGRAYTISEAVYKTYQAWRKEQEDKKK